MSDEDFHGMSESELNELERLNDERRRLVLARVGRPTSPLQPMRQYNEKAPEWAKRLDTWLVARQTQSRRIITVKMFVVAVILTALVSLPALIPACREFYAAFEASRKQLTP